MSDPSQRIIGHMNADHQLALIDYVVYYGNVDSANLVESSVGISSIDSDLVVIDYQTKDSDTFKHFTLKWADATEEENVAVKDLTDLRPKLVSMAQYAAAKRGFSHQQIKKVVPPNARGAIWYVIFAVLAVNIYDPLLLSRLVANDWLFNSVVGYIPQAVKGFYSLVSRNAIKVAAAIYVTHVVEILYFSVPFFKKYRVPTKQRVIWSIMHLFEGFHVIQRLNALAKSAH